MKKIIAVIFGMFIIAVFTGIGIAADSTPWTDRASLSKDVPKVKVKDIKTDARNTGSPSKQKGKKVKKVEEKREGEEPR